MLNGRDFDERSAAEIREMLRFDKIVTVRWKELCQRYAELHTRTSHDNTGGYTHNSPNPAAREEPDYPRMNDGCYWRRAGSRHGKTVSDWTYLMT